MLSLHQILFVPPAVGVAADVIGAFARRDLTVKTTYTGSSIQQRDGLFGQLYDVAVTPMDNAISWSRDCGTAFRIIAQIERTTRLIVFGHPKFRSLRDLGGARLAVDAPDSGLVLVLRAAIEASGVAPGNYSVLACGGVKERLDAMIADRADAGLLGPPIDAAADATGLRRLGEIEREVPDYPGLGLIIRLDRLLTLRPALLAYVDALAESLEWMHSHPVELVGALVTRGFAAGSAQEVLACRPRTLRPDPQGIRRIIELRKRYDSRMRKEATPKDLVYGQLLNEVEVARAQTANAATSPIGE